MTTKHVNRCLTCGQIHPVDGFGCLTDCENSWHRLVYWNSNNPHNVYNIIKNKLEEIGAGGLIEPDLECSCKLNDIAPCGETPMSHPGFLAHGIFEGEYIKEYFYASRNEARAAADKTKEELIKEYEDGI